MSMAKTERRTNFKRNPRRVFFIQEESESDSENDEINQDEGYQEPGQPVILVDDDPNTSNKQALKRRVSFAADVAPDSQSSNEIR